MDIREFFKDCLKDFDKPDNWVDVSYPGGDVCPSFEYNGYQIMVDHPDPEQRELGKLGFETTQTFRFGIRISFEYGVMGWSHATDDFNEVLREIEVPYMTRPLYYDREEYLKEEARKSA